MENKSNKKINPLELESLRSELIEKTLNTSSNNLRLYLFKNYFKKILFLCNPNIEEAFLKEFFDDYISCICKFEVWGVEPDITKELLEQFKKVSTLKIAFENTNLLNSEIDRIEKQLEKLNLILDGKDVEDDETHKAFFPLIDRDAPTGFYGIIESVTVRINKAVDNDKFIIIPSEKEIEKKILEQCKHSWLVALNSSRAYIKKPYKYHEVIISFDKKQGFYEGNSLGIALTLSFLERMLKFYNTAYIINIKEQSAFTGGVTETGEVLCTSEEIIKRKVAAVFFSEINTFIFPKCEETYAYFALTQLKNSYPNRGLKLILVEELNDVINRRDVVDIKKQKVVVRTGKFVKKNWISAVAIILLAIFFAYLFVIDFDDNPASLSADGNTLFIKNKNGKVLWERSLILGKYEFSETELKSVARIIDINEDGVNEILLTKKYDDDGLIIKDYSSVYCYDNKGKIIWRFEFKDVVISKREVPGNDYEVRMIDTLTLYSKKCLMVVSTNTTSFPSALFSINLKTGERLPGTFWAAGHILEGEVKDLDNDNKKEFIGIGYENGFEDVTFFGFEIDSLLKMRPTTDDYLLRNMSISAMKVYIRFPKIDYDYYNKIRTPTLISANFSDNQSQRKYKFAVGEFAQTQVPNLSYGINYNFKDIDIIITSGFRVKRDTLVAHGILKLPYTDTEEYKNLIKRNILYWKNGKWVKRNELD